MHLCESRVHFPLSHSFESRMKGQVVCYSCISYMHDINDYYLHHHQKNHNMNENNITDLYRILYEVFFESSFIIFIRVLKAYK